MAARIRFVPSADASVVSERSREILRAVLDAAGLASCVITTRRGSGSLSQAMVWQIPTPASGSADRSAAMPAYLTLGTIGDLILPLLLGHPDKRFNIANRGERDDQEEVRG
jgi:hypothetical protein